MVQRGSLQRVAPPRGRHARLGRTWHARLRAEQSVVVKCGMPDDQLGQDIRGLRGLPCPGGCFVRAWSAIGTLTTRRAGLAQQTNI